MTITQSLDQRVRPRGTRGDSAYVTFPNAELLFAHLLTPAASPFDQKKTLKYGVNVVMDASDPVVIQLHDGLVQLFLDWAKLNRKEAELDYVFKYNNMQNPDTKKWDVPDKTKFKVNVSSYAERIDKATGETVMNPVPIIWDSTGKPTRLDAEPGNGSKGIVQSVCYIKELPDVRTGGTYPRIVFYLNGVMITDYKRNEVAAPPAYEGGWVAGEPEAPSPDAPAPCDLVHGVPFSSEDVPF